MASSRPGRPRWWRTSFLWTCPLLLLPLAAAPQTRREGSPLEGLQVVDLTHALADGVPVYPGSEPFHLENVARLEQGYYINKFCTGEHVGTHVDAPSHFARGGRDVDQLPLESLIGPLVVLDVRDEAAVNPDLEVDVRHLQAHERRHGPLPSGCFVVANTGSWRKWGDPDAYLGRGRTKDGALHFPGFSPAAAEFLVSRREIRGVGIDTPSTDPGTSATFPEHHAMLGAGKVNLENLTNLDGLPATGAFLVVAPLKLSRGSGAPARIFALVPRAPQP